jgi:hypothetical protein
MGRRSDPKLEQHPRGLHGRDGTLKRTVRAGNPGPQVGETIYAEIIQDGENLNPEGQPYYKIKPVSRPDGFTPAPANGAAPAADGGGKDDAWWYQKDRRISRAGVLQAVVAASKVPAQGDDGKVDGALDAYTTYVNRITDKLLASLDERTPHPSAEGSNYDAAEQHTPTDPEPEVPPVDVVIVRAKQLPLERWLLELAGFGADISNPEQAIRSLSERDRAKFNDKLDAIAQEKQPEPAAVQGGPIADDDSIPF